MFIHVRVHTNARKAVFTAKSGTSFDISVREKAEMNAANSRVVELVAAHFGVDRKRVRIVSGHHSPSKRLELHYLAGRPER